MRIVAGAWRGRALVAPPGQGTRPTADRVRQALFDILMHAEWGGREAIEGAVVLDVFAGTGALGLEALSRGAASACFIESDPAALKALRANVAACRAEERSTVVAGDVFAANASSPHRHGPACPGHPSRHVSGGVARTSRTMTEDANDTGGSASLIFLDPPYAQDLVPRAITHLRRNGYTAPGALIIAETGRDETWLPAEPLLAERQYGAARILVFRTA